MIVWNCKVELVGTPTWGTWTPGGVYMACMYPTDGDSIAYYIVDNEGKPGTLTRHQARVVEPPAPLPRAGENTPGRIATPRMVIDPGAPIKH